jgi:hypothetical protein
MEGMWKMQSAEEKLPESDKEIQDGERGFQTD